jgi:hypothetical protein
MIIFLTIHSIFGFNIPIAIGLTLAVSAVALGFILRRFRAGNAHRPRSRWQIDYESTTGLRLSVRKAPPAASGLTSTPQSEKRRQTPVTQKLGRR